MRSAIEEDRLALRFEPAELDSRGLWIVDRAGARRDPETVLSPDGEPVDLGAPGGATVAAATFVLADLGPPPWTLHALPRLAGGWHAVLAQAERSPVDEAADAFGYQREVRLFPDGTSDVRYVRLGPEGDLVEVPRAVFVESVHPSLSLLFESLPATARAISGCPELAATVAEGLEAGARYRGAREGDNGHPHARGRDFWSPPRFIESVRGEGEEDPVDTLVWYLVELFNATAADAYHRIWRGVLEGKLSEREYVSRETLQKANQLSRAVRTVRASGPCIGGLEWRASGGVVFSEYERWVDSSRGDVRALADIILRNPARYTLSPREAGMTYGERLRGLYRDYSPRMGRLDAQ